MLSEKLEQIVKWTRTTLDPPWPRFGVIQIKDSQFVRGAPKRKLWAEIVKGDDDILALFVGGDLEKTELKMSASDGSGDNKLVALTYEEILAILQANLNEQPSESYWKTEDQPSGWELHGILPKKTVVVFSLEPEISAGCALAVIMLLRWAYDVGNQQDSHIRVLYWTCSRPDEVRDKILDRIMDGLIFKNYKMECFDLGYFTDDETEWRAETQKLPAFDEESLTSGLIDAINEEASGNHAIIGFCPSKTFSIVEKVVDQSLRSTKVFKSKAIHPLNSSQLRTALEPEGQIKLICLPSEAFCPIDLVGFDNIHLILNTSRRRPIFDYVTGQTTNAEVLTSVGERITQLSWARCAPDARVRVYTDMGGKQNYLRQGYQRRRFKFENHQVGGFIAAVCGLPMWDLAPQGTLHGFVRCETTLLEFSTRLCRQGVITNDFQMVLSKDQGQLFQLVLPLVDYDYRVALFLSSPSSDHAVMLAKIELASLLTVGLTDILQLSESACESKRDLLRYCGSSMQLLFKTGSMWTIKGLWDVIRLELKNFEKVQDQSMVSALDGNVLVDVHRSLRACQLIDRLKQVVDKCGIPVAEWSILEFTDKQCRALQRDLLHAFIYQLVCSQTCAIAESPTGWRHREVSDGTRFAPVSKWVACIDMKEIASKEIAQSMLFGVYHSISRDSEVHMRDWTWIPTQLVADWRSVHGNGEPLRSVLAGNHRPTIVKDFAGVSVDE